MSNVVAFLLSVAVTVAVGAAVRRADAPLRSSEFRVLAFLGGDEVGIISSYLTSS